MFFTNFNTAMLPVYICRALAMLLVIPLHESAHAYVSWKLGDSTAKDYGRLTLNPLRHFDVMGVVCLIVAGFGWAKPVPIGANRFRNPKVGMALSAAAGPVSNFLFAYVSIILWKLVAFGLYYPLGNNGLYNFLCLFFQILTIMNITLAVFNMLPVPPLDGSRIFLVFLPQRLYFKIMQYERYIMLALFVLLFIGVLDTPLGVINNFVFNLLDKGSGFIDAMFF